MTNREFYEGLTDAQLEQMKVTLVEEIKQRKEFADKQQNQKPKDPLENVFVPHDEHYYITDLMEYDRAYRAVYEEMQEKFE